jgi:hypothetical protein
MSLHTPLQTDRSSNRISFCVQRNKNSGDAPGNCGCLMCAGAFTNPASFRISLVRLTSNFLIQHDSSVKANRKPSPASSTKQEHHKPLQPSSPPPAASHSPSDDVYSLHIPFPACAVAAAVPGGPADASLNLLASTHFPTDPFRAPPRSVPLVSSHHPSLAGGGAEAAPAAPAAAPRTRSPPPRPVALSCEWPGDSLLLAAAAAAAAAECGGGGTREGAVAVAEADPFARDWPPW